MIHHNGLSIQILDDLAVHRVECRSLIITLEHYMELCFTQLSFEMEQTTNGRPRWICYTYWHCLPWCSFELECTTCVDRSFQVGWWSLIKVESQRGNSFPKFFLIVTRNTCLMEDLTPLKCQPWLFIFILICLFTARFLNFWCFPSADHLQSFKYFFNFFGSCPFLRYV